MEIVDREGVFPRAATPNTDWALDELASKKKEGMAQEAAALATATAAIKVARIPQPASSWRRPVVCSVTKRWYRRAVRSVIRLAVMVTTMIPAAITEEGSRKAALF